jgi:hypothetical protein
MISLRWLIGAAISAGGRIKTGLHVAGNDAPITRSDGAADHGRTSRPLGRRFNADNQNHRRDRRLICGLIWEE